ncbi:aminotransferase, class III superfamily [Rhodovulum sulfidophilum]|uniref:Aminotransferase, class III superfamily n=1 Tax=Rhodovulum sulfidophilum TaxID=35806 RepID=A0A0D6B3U6_RHOSU|nr:aminotransferase, class III superfamily [Rhodovulum sulfidophilum]
MAHARIEAAAFEAGRLCHPMGGTIDGRQGDQVLRTPSLIPGGTHALEITDKLQFALTALR